MLTNSSKGFTLLELMIAVAILGILSAIAYPSFESSIQDNRLTSQTNLLLAALQFARSEAAARGSNVTVCSSSDTATCDDGDWSNGFIIRTGNKVILQIFDGLEAGNTLRGNSTIVFNSQGTVAAGTQLSLCDDRGENYARGIWINGAGQARAAGAPECE